MNNLLYNFIAYTIVEKLKNIAYAMLASSIWGISFPITKAGLFKISPILLAFLRYLIATFIFIFLFSFKKNFFKIEIKKFLFLGLFSVTFPTVFQNIGLKYTSAYISGFLQSTGPIFILILAFIFLNEKITRNKLIGIAMAFIGTYFIVNPNEGNFLGNFLILLSSFSYSIGGIISKNLLKKYSPFQVIFFSSLFGTTFLFPLIFLEKFFILKGAFNYVLYLAIFPTIISYILWYSAMKKMEISRLSFFVYLVPIFSIIASHIVLKEKFIPYTIFWGFIVITGVFIAQKA